LTSITIPNSVTSIGGSTFLNSGLISVTISNSNSLGITSPDSGVSFYGATNVNILLPTP
jgi:hypothetical protein